MTDQPNPAVPDETTINPPTADPPAPAVPPATDPAETVAPPAAEAAAATPATPPAASVTTPPVTDGPAALDAGADTADAIDGPIAPAHAVSRDAGTFGAEAPASRRASGARWAIALGAVAVVVAVSAAIFVLASGRPNTSIAVGYMPNDTLQYAEYRLDLPGDQRAKLAAFLSKFPGFADQAAFDVKLDEVLDRLISAASEGSQNWTGDVKPWFGGTIAMGSGPFDASALAPMAAMPFSGGSPLIAVTVTDRPKAIAWVRKTIGDQVTESEYNGATLLGLGDASFGQPAIVAINDRVMLAGTDAAVRAAIDSKGENKLADDGEFRAAFGTVRGDYVGFSYTEYRAYVQSIINLTGSALGGGGLDQTTVDDEILAMIPAWQASVFRIEDDALVGESSFPSFDIGFKAANRRSGLAGHAPAGSILYAESHDIGQALTALLDRFRQMPDLRDSFGQIDQSAGMIGGFDGLFGWWGDVAVVVSKGADGSLGGGVIIAPTDADKARRLFETLRSFVVLGGRGAGIEIRDVPHGATTFSIVDFSAALGPDAGLPPGVKAEIAFAVTSDVVVIGYGDTFVKEVLDAGAGPSLADGERYQNLVKRVGEENLGVTFVDIQAIRELVEPLVKAELPPEQWSFYEVEIKPYLLPLDAIVSGSRVDGELNRLPQYITVK